MASQGFEFLDLTEVNDEECSQLLSILDLSDVAAPCDNVTTFKEEEEESRESYCSEEESSTKSNSCTDAYLNEETYSKDELSREENVSLQVSSEDTSIPEAVQESQDDGYAVEEAQYYMSAPEYSMPPHMGPVNTQSVPGATPLYIPPNAAPSPNGFPPNSHSIYHLTPPPAHQGPPHMVHPTFYVENCQITLSPFGTQPPNNSLYQNPSHGHPPPCPGQVYPSYLMNDQSMPIHMKQPNDKSSYMQSKHHDQGRTHYRGRGTNRRRREDHERSNSLSSDHSSYNDSGGKSVYKDNSPSSHYASTYLPMPYMPYPINQLTRAAPGVPLIPSQYSPNYAAQHTAHYGSYSQPIPVVSQALDSYSQSNIPVSQPCNDNLPLEDQQMQCVTSATYMVTTKVSTTLTNTECLDSSGSCDPCPISSSEVTLSLETSNATTITTSKILSSNQAPKIDCDNSHQNAKPNISVTKSLTNGSVLASQDTSIPSTTQEAETPRFDKLNDAVGVHEQKTKEPSPNISQVPNSENSLNNTEKESPSVIVMNSSKSQSPVDVKPNPIEEKEVSLKNKDPIIESKNCVNKISVKKLDVIEMESSNLDEESGFTFGEISELSNHFESLLKNPASLASVPCSSSNNITNTLNISSAAPVIFKPSSKIKLTAMKPEDPPMPTQDSKKAPVVHIPPEKTKKTDAFHSLPHPEATPTPAPVVESSAWGNKKKSWSQLFKPSDETQNKQIAYVTPFKESSKDANETVASLAGSDASKSDADDVSKRKIGGLLNKHTQDYRPVLLQPRGLINKNYWCYVNAPLQALLYCPSFFQLMQALSKEAGSSSGNIATPFINGFVDFIKEFSIMPKISKANRKDKNSSSPIKEPEVITGAAFEPMHVYKVLINNNKNQFIEGRQQDAEEMLSCVLNGLHDEMVESLKLAGGIALNAQQPKPIEPQMTDDENADEWKVQGPKKKSCITRTAHFHQSPISEIFWGQLRSVLQQAGGATTANLQPFNTLPLDIQSPKVDSIKDALGQLVTREEISGMTCPKTNQEVTATTQVMLEDLPRVLILQLKRFIYDKDGGLQKVTKRLQFTIDLEITKDLLSVNSRGKFSPSQRKYKLFAIVNHEGKEATKGHYVSDIFHPGYSRWLRCDDSNIMPISESIVLKHDPPRVPYLLFYRRCDSLSHPMSLNTTNGKSRT